MVNIIENWTHVTGIIKSINPDELEGFKSIAIDISETKPFKKYRDLIAAKKKITATLQDESVTAHQLEPGMKISCLVRVAKTTLFIKPDSIKI